MASDTIDTNTVHQENDLEVIPPAKIVHELRLFSCVTRETIVLFVRALGIALLALLACLGFYAHQCTSGQMDCVLACNTGSSLFKPSDCVGVYKPRYAWVSTTNALSAFPVDVGSVVKTGKIGNHPVAAVARAAQAYMLDYNLTCISAPMFGLPIDACFFTEGSPNNIQMFANIRIDMMTKSEYSGGIHQILPGSKKGGNAAVTASPTRLSANYDEILLSSARTSRNKPIQARHVDKVLSGEIAMCVDICENSTYKLDKAIPKGLSMFKKWGAEIK